MRSLLLASVALATFPRAFSEVAETVMVTVKGNSNGPVRVNKSDFDADQAEGGEKRFTLNKTETANQPGAIVGDTVVSVAPGLQIPPAPSAPAFVDPIAPTTANADTLFVAKEGKRFFVTRADGQKVTDMRDIEPKGYATDTEAWAAVVAAKKQPHEQGDGGANVGHTALTPETAPTSELPPQS